MELNKETLKQARRAPTPATHRAVLAALDVLDKQPAHKHFVLPRWAVVAATTVAVAALVAAVPPLRHRAANLALDVLGRTIPQADRVNPAAAGEAPLPSATAPTANPNSAFLNYGDPYKPLATISTFPNVSQTVNGITVTVDEAALTVDRLFLVLHIDNAPKISNLWPTGEVKLDGQGTSYSLEGDCKEFGLCADLPKIIEEPGIELPVYFSFNLVDQSSDDTSQYYSLGSFTLDFTVRMGNTLMKLNDNNGMLPYSNGSASPTEAAPAAAVTQTPSPTDLSQATAEAETTDSSAAESTALPTTIPSSGPETTAMPSSAPQTTAKAVDSSLTTPMPSGYTARPKYDPQAEGWTVQNVAIGNKTLAMAAPSQLKRFDLGTPKLNVQAASAVLSKNNGADGVDV